MLGGHSDVVRLYNSIVIVSTAWVVSSWMGWGWAAQGECWGQVTGKLVLLWGMLFHWVGVCDVSLAV